MKTMQIAFSVLVALFLAIATITLVWVLGEQEKYIKDPDAIVFHDGVATKAQTHLVTIRYPPGSVGFLSHFLLVQPLWLNWGVLYVAAGILGWCGSVWLRIYKKKELSGFLVSLLLASLAGACAYLLVRILMALISPLRDLDYLLTVVAIAGGLFVTTFYDELEKLLTASSGYLRRKLGDRDAASQAASAKDKKKEQE